MLKMRKCAWKQVNNCMQIFRGKKQDDQKHIQSNKLLVFPTEDHETSSQHNLQKDMLNKIAREMTDKIVLFRAPLGATSNSRKMLE